MIVLLLTSCITLGIGLATKTFDKTYTSSKAQTLASTLNYHISEELRTATDVKAENGEIIYKSGNYTGTYNGANGNSKCVKMKVSDKGQLYVDTHDESDSYHAGGYYTFGAPSLYGKSLQVKDFSINKENQVFKVKYTIVDKKNQNIPLATSEFQVKCMDS